MSTRRPQLQAGYVLHHRPYRDTSLVVDVFTRTAGRLALVARGARRPRASQRSLLQPFRPLLLSWRLGGGEMGTLTAVEADGYPPGLSGDALMSGFYLNELVLRLLGRHDPNEAIFDLYAETLAALPAGPTAPVLRRFEKLLLDGLGYALPVHETGMDGQTLDPDSRYRFDPESGAWPLAGSEGRGYSGRTLLALARANYDEPSVQPEMRRLLAEALQPHLGGKPLQTARVMRDLTRRGLRQTRSEPSANDSDDKGDPS
ncbi:DNA repair protein RecO [Gammaproteobacteria bacterium AB-CW1]|uniref:DNA repair protein RecO n=1 Tax=Natronospira elongata TaxID=3110268 RepID=A0AAP6JH94_9GAMM|nr:DNA repair protein RecO [Gammaproteobacteria bacterium AB-CW1]